jgi:cytochrome c2
MPAGIKGGQTVKSTNRIAWCLAVPGAALAASAFAGIFDAPKNLKVLPANIAPQQLGQTMRGFAQDLGLRCENCHVGEAGRPLESFDFAADQKQTKATARMMLRMVADINERQLAGLDRPVAERVVVTCATCHRGQSRPTQIGDELELAYREGRAPAAVARYRSLKAAYFGAGGFDFTERPRLEFAMRLAARSDARGGIEFLNALREEHGAGFMTDMTLADLYLAAGDRPAATDALQEALISAPPPAQPILRKRLEELTRHDPAQPQNGG